MSKIAQWCGVSGKVGRRVSLTTKTTVVQDYGPDEVIAFLEPTLHKLMCAEATNLKPKNVPGTVTAIAKSANGLFGHSAKAGNYVF